MKCENVVLEEEEEDEEADEPQSINLTTSLLKGKWACIFTIRMGEQYVPVNNYTITNMTIVPSTTNNMFIGTWGTRDLEGGIVDQKTC